MALKPRGHTLVSVDRQSCSPLLRGDGPETIYAADEEDGRLPCSPLLRGDGPETCSRHGTRSSSLQLAVPSYGAMALKHIV